MTLTIKSKYYNKNIFVFSAKNKVDLSTSLREFFEIFLFYLIWFDTSSKDGLWAINDFKSIFEKKKSVFEPPICGRRPPEHHAKFFGLILKICLFWECISYLFCIRHQCIIYTFRDGRINYCFFGANSILIWNTKYETCK